MGGREDERARMMECERGRPDTPVSPIGSRGGRQGLFCRLKCVCVATEREGGREGGRERERDRETER